MPHEIDSLSAGASTPLSRRGFLGRVGVGAAAAAAGTGLYAWRVEPHWVEFTEQPMPLAGLPERLAGKRLLQLSDLHVGRSVDADYLRGVLRQAAELAPDYIALTGDFMTSHRDEQVGPTLDLLRELPSGTPKVAVLGNHDFGDSPWDPRVGDRLAGGLREIGVEVLRNDATWIDGLQFAGCDDLWAGECDVWKAVSKLDNGAPTVFLAHNPDTADRSGWGTMHGWILSGHTHGGQCRFPLVGRPVLPVRNRAYAAGHVALDGRRHLYVNRGVGHHGRVRFGARPEVTVFTLESAPALA